MKTIIFFIQTISKSIFTTYVLRGYTLEFELKNEDVNMKYKATVFDNGVNKNLFQKKGLSNENPSYYMNLELFPNSHCAEFIYTLINSLSRIDFF